MYTYVSLSAWERARVYRLGDRPGWMAAEYETLVQGGVWRRSGIHGRPCTTPLAAARSADRAVSRRAR